MSIQTIQIKRGLLAHLPALKDGELAFTEDTGQLWIGSASGSNTLLFAGGTSAGSAGTASGTGTTTTSTTTTTGGTGGTGGTTSPPVTPTTVTLWSPSTGSTLTAIPGSFRVSFSGAMNATSVTNASNWTLTSTIGSISGVSIAYDATLNIATVSFTATGVTTGATLSLSILPGMLDANSLPLTGTLSSSYPYLPPAPPTTGTVPTFTNTTISGLQRWLKADAGVTGTSAVTAWLDQSTNARSFVPYSGHGPALVSNAQNSLPAMRYSATSLGTWQSLDDRTGFASALTAATIIIFHKPANTSTTMCPFQGWDNVNYGILTNRNAKFATGVGESGPLTYLDSSTVAASAPHAVALTWDTTTNQQMMLLVDGAQVGQSAVGQDYATLSNVRIGAGAQTTYTSGIPDTYYYAGDIYEVLIFNRVLNSTELATVNTYLQAKWLAIFPPSAGSTVATSWSPPAGSGLASVPSTFTVNFNSTMNSSSVQNTANWGITSTHGTISISGVVLTNGVSTASAVVSVTSSGVLTGDTIEITLNSAIKDSNGFSINTPLVFDWLMSNSPQIIGQTPAAGTVGSVPTSVVVSFNQAMGTSAAVKANWAAVALVPGTSDPAGTISVTNAVLSSDAKSVTLTLSPTKVYSGAQIKITASSLVAVSGTSLGGTTNFSYNYYNNAVGTLTGLPIRCLATTSTWNQLLPESPTLASYSATQIGNLVDIITHGVKQLPVGVSGVKIDSSWGNIGPVYFLSPADPTVVIKQVGGYGDLAGTQPMPTGAQAAGGSDAHVTILNATTGDEYDYYQFNLTNVTIAQGANLSVTAGGKANYYTGSGWEEGIGPGGSPGPLDQGLGGYVTSAGNTLMAGVVTIDELMSGQINHALSIATWGNAATPGVWPATAAAAYPNAAYSAAQGYGAMPGPGSLIWSDLTDAQVDALGWDVMSTLILKAMHRYGAFVTDTEGYVSFNFRQIGCVPALNTSAQTQCNNWIDANTVNHNHDTANNFIFSLQAQPASWFKSHFHLIDPTWLNTQRGGVR